MFEWVLNQTKNKISCSNELQVEKKIANSNFWQRKSISCSNDFVFTFSIVHQTWSSMNIIILIMREFSNLIHKMIEQKHIYEFDDINNDDAIKSLTFSSNWFVHCIKFRAIQMRQKLVIFDMSCRHWQNRRKWNIMTQKLFVRFVKFYRKNVFRAKQISDRTFRYVWNVFWSQYENIVNRIKREMIHRTLNTILACKKRS